MNDISKYIDKYGQRTFKEVEFTEIDNLIFSQIPYINFSNIVSDNDNKITLHDASDTILNDNNKHLNLSRRNLLKKIKDTKRYKDILLSNFIYKLTNEEQFGAITLDLDEDLRCISYEGTDNTLTGWKEDFEFSYKFPVPAQKDAIKYLNKVGKKAKKIILTGHSKGGNLALVAGMYSKFYIKNKIIKIYSNDGPGLRKEEATSANFKSIKDRYEKIIPKYSIFGLLFNDLKNEKVIDCNAIGILAHSVFTWKVDDKNLITAPLSKFSANLDNNFTKWSSQFNYKNREIFSNYLFEILVKNNIKTINDFIKIKPTDFQKILKEIQVDPKFKKSLMEFLTFLKTYYVGDINKKTDKLASKVINS